jgi:hypothetical protein
MLGGEFGRVGFRMGTTYLGPRLGQKELLLSSGARRSGALLHAGLTMLGTQLVSGISNW